MDAFESAFQNVISVLGSRIEQIWESFVETVVWFAKDQSLALGYHRDDNPILWHTWDFLWYMADRLSLRVPAKLITVRTLDFEPRMVVPQELLVVSSHPLVAIHYIQSI